MISTPPPAPAFHENPAVASYMGWEGYGQSASKYIQANFKAPSGQYPDGDVGLFAGIGGSPTNPASPIQRAGVYMVRTGGVTADYVPWFQVSPGPPQLFPGTPPTVHPGDAMALIVSKGSGTYTVVVRDVTQGWQERDVVHSTDSETHGEIAAQAFGTPGPNGFSETTFTTPGSLSTLYAWPFASAAHTHLVNAHEFELFGP